METQKEEDEEKYLAPCEGTFPICCAADLSQEVISTTQTISLLARTANDCVNSLCNDLWS